MRPSCLIVLVVLSLGSFAIAQSADGTQISDRLEVFAGYMYARPDFSLVNPNGGVNGWNALAAGGGIDYWLKPRIAIRGQADWLYTRLTMGPAGTYAPPQNRNVARISTGIVCRF